MLGRNSQMSSFAKCPVGIKTMVVASATAGCSSFGMTRMHPGQKNKSYFDVMFPGTSLSPGE